MKIVIVGAGPVGALAALYAARRGHEVEVYEMRDGSSTSSLVGAIVTKSINLTISERGLLALSHSGSDVAYQNIVSDAVQVYGRMVHGENSQGKLSEKGIRYDIHGKPLHVVDRQGLNQSILDELRNLPNVKILFRHKLLLVDSVLKSAEFQTPGGVKTVDVQFDLIIGADGAHSTTRAQLAKKTRMNITQTWFDILWCEVKIPALLSGTTNPYRLSPRHLHVWPQRDFMFIALPDMGGTFTCNLFGPERIFRGFEEEPSTIVPFFKKHFPGVVPNLVAPEALEKQFLENPHSSLLDVRCSPYHLEDCGVIIGDAAHTMVPFYGQGLNTGLEDVRILFEDFLDRIDPPKEEAPRCSKESWEVPNAAFLNLGQALAAYSKSRKPDLDAINELALANYKDMRTGASSYTYRSRKFIEERLSLWAPALGWSTLYHRVAFGNIPYAQAQYLAKKQGRILGLIGAGLAVVFLRVCFWLLALFGDFGLDSNVYSSVQSSVYSSALANCTC